MKISFKTVDTFPGWKKAEMFFQKKINAFKAKSILEIGSGANPTISLNYIEKKNLEYTTNDTNVNELNKAPSAYKILLLDFSSNEIPYSLHNNYDLVFSRMVNEHIKNGKDYYSNIFKALKKGGVTIHCFSTLYCIPFLMNRILPEFLSDKLLSFISPGRNEHLHGKFRAYYSWSRGPTNKMIRRFESVGYQIIEYAGFFGHDYYRNKIPLLHKIERAKSAFLCSQLKIPHLTSYAYVILQKPK